MSRQSKAIAELQPHVGEIFITTHFFWACTYEFGEFFHPGAQVILLKVDKLSNHFPAQRFDLYDALDYFAKIIMPVSVICGMATGITSFVLNYGVYAIGMGGVVFGIIVLLYLLVRLCLAYGEMFLLSLPKEYDGEIACDGLVYSDFKMGFYKKSGFAALLLYPDGVARWTYMYLGTLKLCKEALND